MSKDRNALLKALELVDDYGPARGTTPRPGATAQRTYPSRAGMKHIGAYLDRDTVRKFVLLRHQLELDNSELFSRLIDEEFARQEALAKFGG